MKFNLLGAALVAAATIAGTTAQGSTVTLNFDGVTNGCGVCGPMFPSSIVEQGVTIGNTPATLAGSNVHLDAAGTSFSSSVSFSMGAPFSVLGVDVLGLGSGLLKDVFDPVSGNTTTTEVPFQNVLFQGFKSGMAVASLFFSTGTMPQTFNLTFGSAFSNLDSFVISALSPSYPPDTATTQYYCTSPECGHFSIDNLKLASVSAVPLPAAAWLLGGAVLLLGAAGRRRRA